MTSNTSGGSRPSNYYAPFERASSISLYSTEAKLNVVKRHGYFLSHIYPFIYIYISIYSSFNSQYTIAFLFHFLLSSYRVCSCRIAIFAQWYFVKLDSLNKFLNRSILPRNNSNAVELFLFFSCRTRINAVQAEKFRELSSCSFT